MEMWRHLRTKMLSLHNLMAVTRPDKRLLREKAIAVAGRVSMVKDGECIKVSCPVCLEVIRTSLDSDLKMILAVHLSLWHPEDVKLQWEIMQNRKASILHLPSFVIGVGVAAGIGALLAFLGKNQPRALVNKERQLVFKLR